jgi:hypothetical protein
MTEADKMPHQWRVRLCGLPGCCERLPCRSEEGVWCDDSPAWMEAVHTEAWLVDVDWSRLTFAQGRWLVEEESD